MASLKATRRALILNVVTLLLCVTMLIGTTYAWFSDSVSSGQNRIEAGNLDVALYHMVNKEKTEVTESTKLFEMKYWQPGVAVHEDFTVENAGDMDLYFELALDVVSQNYVKQGDSYISLANILRVAVIETPTYANPNYINLAKTQETAETKNKTLADAGCIKNGAIDAKVVTIDPSTATYAVSAHEMSFTVVIYWDPDKTLNEFNAKGETYIHSADGDNYTLDAADKLPTITLGIELKAGQEEAEADGFGTDYDSAAELVTESPAPAPTDTP